ncbi:BA75_00651T0 [Komagataella pastoris]|uniref:BA75_00651T0 n=1 Tax=Komagataella pastoris TaxID=4922 RepID=A0A1B2J9V6_PICPA|nr:BA75_00651T0 [Komagataella pastoris]
MKFSTAFAGLVALNAVSIVAQEEATDAHVVTTTVTTASTETHRWGRFDKTTPSTTSTSSGTHRWGRFDKTANPTTTTIFSYDGVVHREVLINGSNSSNHSNTTTSSYEGLAASGAGAQFGLVGAAAIGLLMVL